MKCLVIYYSYSGNNRVLAEETAKVLNADIFEIRDVKERTHAGIALDMLLRKYPKIESVPDRVSEYDLTLFFSPIWMFGIASPVRSCMKAIGKQINKYAFVSVSGGALGPNTKIPRELVKRLGKNQAFTLDLSIANFLLGDGEKDVKKTSCAQLEKGSEELNHLVLIISSAVKGLKL